MLVELNSIEIELLQSALREYNFDHDIDPAFSMCVVGNIETKLETTLNNAEIDSKAKG